MFVLAEPEEEVVQRKSGRVRKPKQFKDSVTPSYIKKSVQRSLQTSQEESTTDGPLEAEAGTSCFMDDKKLMACS